MTYYVGNGKNQDTLDALYTRLVEKAPAKSPHGEFLRAAMVLYFERLNKGSSGQAALEQERATMKKLVDFIPNKKKLLTSFANGKISAKSAEDAFDEVVCFVRKLQGVIE
jgi:hypothetical protein